jgi:hypothetical protein
MNYIKKTKKLKNKKNNKNYSKKGNTNTNIHKINKKNITDLFDNLYETLPINFQIRLSKNKSDKPNLNDSDSDSNSDSDSKSDSEILIKEYSSYYYDSFLDNISKLIEISKERVSLRNDINNDYHLHEKIRKEITEGYTRGVSQYISSRIKLKYRVSNAFCKLWELFSIVNGLFPLKANPNVFFIAEAPGQWIFSSKHYYQTKYLNKLTSSNNAKKSELEWRANSLNPKHPINIKQFGSMFGDDYGFIKNNPDKWIYGKDGTGNIFSVQNQKWYYNFAKNFPKFDLITGDAGLAVTEDNLEILQKLEYACVCMVAGTASIGSNCVMKHFLPFGVKMKESDKSSGFFVNYIYLYYLLFDELRLVKPLTSNPNSGEFYVVCKGFCGISEENYNKLLNILDNFKTNICFFDRKDIPQEFIELVSNFNNQVIARNIKHKEVGIKIIDCIKDKEIYNQNIDCKIYLDKSIVKNIHWKIFNYWIKKTGFTK